MDEYLEGIMNRRKKAAPPRTETRAAHEARVIEIVLRLQATGTISRDEMPAALRTALSAAGLVVVEKEPEPKLQIDPTRCPVCDWPLAESQEKGCIPGDCSYRPEPGTPEYTRISKRRAMLATAGEPTALKEKQHE